MKIVSNQLFLYRQDKFVSYQQWPNREYKIHGIYDHMEVYAENYIRKGYSKEDSIIWDFIGRRPLSVINFIVASIEDGLIC